MGILKTLAANKGEGWGFPDGGDSQPEPTQEL